MRRVVKTKFPLNPLIDELSVLGAAVRASRTEAGMTLAEAAMTLQITPKTLADLESGKPTVSLGIALKVAHGFGLSLLVIRDTELDFVMKTLVGHNL